MTTAQPWTASTNDSGWYFRPQIINSKLVGRTPAAFSHFSYRFTYPFWSGTASSSCWSLGIWTAKNCFNFGSFERQKVSYKAVLGTLSWFMPLENLDIIFFWETICWLWRTSKKAIRKIWPLRIGFDFLQFLQRHRGHRVDFWDANLIGLCLDSLRRDRSAHDMLLSLSSGKTKPTKKKDLTGCSRSVAIILDIYQCKRWQAVSISVVKRVKWRVLLLKVWFCVILSPRDLSVIDASLSHIIFWSHYPAGADTFQSQTNLYRSEIVLVLLCMVVSLNWSMSPA